MSVFIDVFNNLLKYNEQEVFIVVDKYNQIWFKLKDIVKLLGYNDYSRTVSRININNNNKIHYNKIKLLPSMAVPHNFQQSTIFIDESDLYKLLSNSKKEMAEKFRDEIFTNALRKTHCVSPNRTNVPTFVVLPSIRKTGEYNVNKNDREKIKILNEEITQLKNNQRNIKYSEGKAIYG